MVDRTARDRAADVVEKYLRGQITLTDLCKILPAKSNDAALAEIGYHIQFICEDFQIVDGRSGLPAFVRSCCERSVLFLKSDLEWPWPSDRLWPRVLCLLAAVAAITAIFVFPSKSIAVFCGLATAAILYLMPRAPRTIGYWPFRSLKDFEAEFARAQKSNTTGMA
jgi:hypothetical protein